MSRRQRKAQTERRRRAAVARRVTAAGGLAVAATLLSGAVAQAENTITVTNTGDSATSGSGSLRDAITQANTYGAASTIVFASDVSGSIDLGSALPDITEPVTITGPGAGVLTINGGGPTRTSPSTIFDIGSGLTASEISGLTLTGGDSKYGGAIETSSPLTVDAVTVTGNDAPGEAEGGGGGIEGDDAALTIENSTISGNTGLVGGGVFGDGGAVTITNSTIDNNTATTGGGGGIFEEGAPLTVTGSTITGNTDTATGTTAGDGDGGGIYISDTATSAALQDTIVSGNTATNGGQDIYTSTSGTPPVPTASFSLIGVVTGSGITPDATDLVGANPMLGPLQNNGGPTGTPTMAPAFNSPVIDQGKAFGSTTDGRGLARPVDLPGYPNATGGDGSDIGAVELQAYEVVPVVSGLSASSGTAGTPVVISGTRLSTAVGVLFGSTPATFKANSSGQLVATVPAGAGTVDVRVITPGGESSVVATDKFTYPTAVTPPVTPPASQVTSAKFGNQTITLTTPSLSACTAKTSKLSAKLTSAAVAGSKATKLRFSSAGFFIDRGVKHVKKKTEHLKHGKTKKITVTTYTANTVVHHVPATVSLKLTSLKSGSHTLKVVVSYRETVTKHHHKKTVTVTKTISSKFKVC